MLELLHLHLVFMALIMWLPRMKLAMNRVTCPLSLGISLGSLIDGAYSSVWCQCQDSCQCCLACFGYSS